MKAVIRPVVLTGPSGTGKSTILNRAMKEYPNAFAFSVSHTTRKPRDGEEDGVHYYFITKAEFEDMVKNNKFVEHATFGGNMYGTSRKAIEDIQHLGKICVLDIELQGVRQLKAQQLSAKFLLIRAPSIEILEQRLRNRGTETEATIQQRLQHAREDDAAAQAEPHFFDIIIVNDILDKAYEEFISAISEQLKQLKDS